LTDPLTILLEITVRAGVVLVVAALLAALVERHRPRLAQTIWIIGCVVFLLLPVLMFVAPTWKVAISYPPMSFATVHAVGDATPSTVEAASPESAPWNHVRYRSRMTWAARSIVVLYLMGVSILLIRLGRDLVRLRAVQRSLEHSRDDNLSAIATAVVGRPTEVRIDPTCRVPLTVGLVHPSVLLPSSVTTWPDYRVRASLAHESAHVKHRDSLWALVAQFVRALYWFHPAGWLPLRAIRRLAENASDDEAIAALGDTRIYARTLYELSLEVASGSRLRLGSPMARSSVSRRIERILGRRGGLRGSTGVVERVALLSATILLSVGGAMVGLDTFRNWRPLATSPLGKQLLVQLESEDPEQRADALFKLARWQDRQDEVTPLLLARLGDSASIRKMPRWNYLTEGWGPARASLVAPSPGEVAALGLASMGGVVSDELVEKLRDPDPVVRRNAAWAIGEMRHPRNVSPSGIRSLTEALRDSDPYVRAAAVWSLGDIGAIGAAGEVRALIESEPSPEVKRDAVTTLRALESGVNLEHYRRQLDKS